MVLEGTVVNGSVVIKGGTRLPEGAHLRIELVEALPPDHPMAPYDRETELRILRESVEDMKAGRGRPAREVLKEVAIKYNLPLEPGE
jgi:hypothetical protein